MAFDPGPVGGKPTPPPPKFKDIVAKDNAYADQLKQTPEGGNAAEIQRNASKDKITTEGFLEAEVAAGKDRNDINVVMTAFDKGDHTFTEAEFNTMQAMLDNPTQMHLFEKMVTDIYADNSILATGGKNNPDNKPDGAGLSAWTKRAFEIQAANPTMSLAQVQETLQHEIVAAKATPVNAAPGSLTIGQPDKDY